MLQDAVERALCSNPKTREAWINIEIQAFNLGISLASYLPSISGSWQETYEATSTAIPAYPQYDSSFSVFAGSGNAELTWTLYDFGGRKASVRGARYLLSAAQSSASSALQEVFTTTAGHYLAVQSASEKASTAFANKAIALESLEVTRERVRHGAAPLSDSLQAETAYLQTVVATEQAEGTLASAHGTLAFDEGLPPDASFSLSQMENNLPKTEDIEQAASSLLDETLRKQPNIATARSQVLAAQAKVSQIRSSGMPSINLIGKISRSQQPASISLGIPPFLSTVHDSYIGAQINIPVFDGFVHAYQTKQAKAQVALQQEMFHETERQSVLDTWTALQDEKTAARTVLSSHALVELAERSYEVSKERYLSGVGAVVDLLAAQKSLQSARDQFTDCLTKWHTSQFALGSKIGRLSIDRLKAGETP